jgi:catalase
VVPQSLDAAGETAPSGADFLEKDLVQRLASGPLRWQLNMTLANPGDPLDDASKTWAGEHKVINAGTLVLQSSQPQADGDCRDINFDPLILPSGIEASNDPLLAARSAAYASSYLRRAGEVSPLHSAPAESKP